jgi:hypothetical protein
LPRDRQRVTSRWPQSEPSDTSGLGPASREATAGRRRLVSPPQARDPTGPPAAAPAALRRDQKLSRSRCVRDSSRADARSASSRDRRDVGSIVDQLAGDTTNGSVLGSGAPTAAVRTHGDRLSVT